MALAIVREQTDDGEREFELGHENLRRVMELTGLGEIAIYTALNSGESLQDRKYRWVMVRQ